eukprot:CAMPEP_0180418052 /NCGR_PEP_ID=MMETSP1036_2-20121128/1357_1 /TAXON_ID=632150 /ORGANISM="Azadinium spinosum, Strain 3D9" /LENGTH=217 /DNA_ID=CAMNT_0022423115 /DNA_START=139 /DNA_END=791 /DNA_ORIENTATION=-
MTLSASLWQKSLKKRLTAGLFMSGRPLFSIVLAYSLKTASRKLSTSSSVTSTTDKMPQPSPSELAVKATPRSPRLWPWPPGSPDEPWELGLRVPATTGAPGSREWLRTLRLELLSGCRKATEASGAEAVPRATERSSNRRWLHRQFCAEVGFLALAAACRSHTVVAAAAFAASACVAKVVKGGWRSWQPNGKLGGDGRNSPSGPGAGSSRASMGNSG